MYQYQVGSLSDIVKPYPLGMFVTEKLLFCKKKIKTKICITSHQMFTPPSPLAVVI